VKAQLRCHQLAAPAGACSCACVVLRATCPQGRDPVQSRLCCCWWWLQEAGSGRLRGQLLLMLAQQHLDTANLLAARKGLLAVAHCYRRWAVKGAGACVRC
jgi:hypothetical protein